MIQLDPLETFFKSKFFASNEKVKETKIKQIIVFISKNKQQRVMTENGNNSQNQLLFFWMHKFIILKTILSSQIKTHQRNQKNRSVHKHFLDPIELNNNNGRIFKLIK